MMENYLQRAGTFKSSILIDLANYVGWPLLAIYCFSMFAYPWLGGSWSWKHVQEVWDRWQTFNAGALAFAASLVAFNISRFNENRQRERDFIAAKAFLPSTLSGLMEYCTQSARIYGAMWESVGAAVVVHEHPDFPKNYREVFSNCIRHADPAVGSYLSNILVRLQVHDARLRDAIAKTPRVHERVVDRPNLISYLMRLGELHSLIGNLFSFARGEDIFQEKPLTWSDFRTAYAIMELKTHHFYIDETTNLQALTNQWIERPQGPASATAK